MDFPRPILTVDVIVFTLCEGVLHVVLLARDREPFAGCQALVGGYVHLDEDADTGAAAARILKKELGLDRLFMEQLMTFSGRTRDPRGWSASVAYFALVEEVHLAPALRRGAVARPAEAVRGLPFDHDAMLAKAVERLRNKGAYSSLPAFLLPTTFTLPQLREVYEKVMGVPLNDSAFRRKIDDLKVIEPVEGAFSTVSARPAQLYRLRRDALTEFDRKL